MKDYKVTTGDYENTNRGFVMKKISSKAKAIIIVVTGIVILLSVLIGNTLIRNYRITNELTAIAKSYGLRDIKISIGGKIPEYDFYEVTVDSSNLESLSYSQMYSLADSMHADDAYVSTYTSNGNSYEIFSYTKSIYKNGHRSGGYTPQKQSGFINWVRNMTGTHWIIIILLFLQFGIPFLILPIAILFILWICLS